jgi:hypothetical protein
MSANLPQSTLAFSLEPSAFCSPPCRQGAYRLKRQQAAFVACYAHEERGRPAGLPWAWPGYQMEKSRQIGITHLIGYSIRYWLEPLVDSGCDPGARWRWLGNKGINP